jgi:plastocyanin
MTGRSIVAAALAAALLVLTQALAAEVHRVAQKGRQFAIAAIAIARGDSLQFTNEDEFLHQIYVASPDFRFDSAEQRPGQIIDLAFPVRGVFEVRCHIHPKMLLTVNVQ